MEKQQLKDKYVSLGADYERLAGNLRNALACFLKDKGIDYAEIQNRIKPLDSFLEKCERKKYADPFNDLKDICGLRIIYYYESDTHLIDNIIRSEFIVSETEDKIEYLQADQFGYRSRHYIVSVPESWLSAPNYRGLGGLFAEIQIRTILMHAWAAISHKLAYKKETDIPHQFKRTLFRLSALIELADQQFDLLRSQRDEYMASLVEGTELGQQTFNLSAPLNVDSLKALLNYMCPERVSSDDQLSNLVEELREANVSLKDIYIGFVRVGQHLQELEKDTYNCMGDSPKYDGVTNRWSQEGFVRGILDVTSESYLRKRIDHDNIPTEVAENAKKWMTIINDAQEANPGDAE